MSKPIDWVLELFFPTRCILCREHLSPGRPRICPRCRESLHTAEDEHKKGDFFSDCVAALYYRDDVRQAILRFKFHGAEAYACAFGELVAERIYAEYPDGFDVLSWVPLAPDRRRKRGYDQTKLIAEDAARRLCVPLTPLLKKRRGVHAQSMTRGREARRANIAGAFSVLPSADVRDKRVLLIDDIVTTGSTLSECAKTLLLAGADEVKCAALAIAKDEEA